MICSINFKPHNKYGQQCASLLPFSYYLPFQFIMTLWPTMWMMVALYFFVEDIPPWNLVCSENAFAWIITRESQPRYVKAIRNNSKWSFAQISSIEKLDQLPATYMEQFMLIKKNDNKEEKWRCIVTRPAQCCLVQLGQVLHRMHPFDPVNSFLLHQVMNL